MCGNRDFLLGDRYCQQAGMTRLEEPAFIGAGSDRIALLHGDTLCTDDVSYQKFRIKARNPDWQRKLLRKPVWVRRLLARLARLLSRRHTGSTAYSIMDVNDQAVHTAFIELGVQRIIHGHTHRQAIHALEVQGRACQRLVLGDWDHSGSLIALSSSGAAGYQIERDRSGQIVLKAWPLTG